MLTCLPSSQWRRSVTLVDINRLLEDAATLVEIPPRLQKLEDAKVRLQPGAAQLPHPYLRVCCSLGSSATSSRLRSTADVWPGSLAFIICDALVAESNGQVRRTGRRL